MMNLSKPESEGASYLKWQPGENKIRIVKEMIDGWETWDNSDKNNPKVYRQPAKFTTEEHKGLNTDGKQRQFYAGLVWNYVSEKLEIMTITQKSIKEAIYFAATDPDWGSYTGYDFVVTKTGSGMDTSYSILPKPHKEFEFQEVVDSTFCDLKRLYINEDPFEEQ